MTILNRIRWDKFIRLFGLCVLLTSTLFMTHTFFVLSWLRQSYCIVAPYGEAPLEFFISVLGCLIGVKIIAEFR